MDERVRYLVALAELERAAKAFAFAGLVVADYAGSLDENPELVAAASHTIEICRRALGEAVKRAPHLRDLLP